MITFEQVTKRYEGAGEMALREVSFNVKKGEFIFVIGESGAGKTTLVKLLLKEIEPSGGRILVNGQLLSSIKSRNIPLYRRNLGVIFQDFRIVNDKTIYENIALAQQIMGVSMKSVRQHVTSMLSLLGLTNQYNRYPKELSGGEQQKVCLARAIINNPSILLADEPTGNLDPESTKEIMQLLEEIQKRGTTVVVITHDMEQVKLHGHRVIDLGE